MKALVYVLLSSLLIRSVSAQEADDHAFTCHPHDERGRYRAHNVDFLTLDLHVGFDVQDERVDGRATYLFKPKRFAVDTLYLDGPGLEVSEVRMDGQRMDVIDRAEGLTILFPMCLDRDTTYRLDIEYSCHPRKGLYFVGWDDPSARRRRQIWTQGQGIDNRHWIPGFDDVADKLVTSTHITFDSGWTVLSNGLLDTVECSEGTCTWRYSMHKPQVLYLVMIAIGDYDMTEMVSDNGIVTRQYVYPDMPETVGATYAHSAEMMDWMEHEYGVPYPWRIYRNIPVEDFLYGAMENTTSTIFTDYYLKDERAALERSYVQTNAHELVHQWFGDYVTEWSSRHHWLHESFATHYAKHFTRTVEGEDWFDWERRQEMESAWRAAAHNDYPVAYSNAGSARHYPKGSIVLDMLRSVVGDEGFRATVQRFLRKHPYDHVDTHLFYLCFMEELGVNLDWFFDQWIYNGGEPHIRIRQREQNTRYRLYVEQTQEVNDWVGYFEMPVWVQVFYDDGTSDSILTRMDGQYDTITIPKRFDAEIELILYDPGWTILKTLEHDKSDAEWMVQARRAPEMIDRYDALVALRDVEARDKRDILLTALQTEDFHALRSEAVRQLADDDGRKARKAVEAALTDDHHLVRREALKRLDEPDDDVQALVEDMLDDPSYVNVEKALHWLMRHAPEHADRYLDRIDGVDGMNRNVLIARLRYASETDPYALDRLVDLAGPSFEMRTRTGAMEVLETLDHFDDAVLVNLIDALFSFNRRLAGPARRHLQNLMEDASRRRRIERAFAEGDWTDREQEAIDRVFQ